MPINKIRVSIGSASVLGLRLIKLKSPPTTCYLMTYKEGHCIANCGFCPQARDSYSSTANLSRISWPTFSFAEFLISLKNIASLNKFKRICIQTLNYPNNFQDLLVIITQIRKVISIPISVAIPPMSKEQLKELKSIGVQRVGIALDGSTPEIFDLIKGKGVNGPYNWDIHFKSLRDAIEIFAKGFVSTHLIVGLGETQKDILKQIEEVHNLAILPSLFAFTPIEGTKFEHMLQPDLLVFRQVQLGRYLIMFKNKKIKDFNFNSKGDITNFNITKKNLKDIVNDGEAFLTLGCPGCNRPFYTSRPSGPTYNYPRKLNKAEKEDIYNLLQIFVN